MTKPYGILKKRPQFVRVAREGRRLVSPFFILQYLIYNEPQQTEVPQIGFTASKKVGNAVTRNKAKRRLRALVHESTEFLPHKKNVDIVLIARKMIVIEKYSKIKEALVKCLKTIQKS